MHSPNIRPVYEIVKFALKRHDFILFTFFIVNEFLSWPLLRFWNVYGSNSDFIDLRWIWHSADCFNQVGFGIYAEKGAFCGGYQYGYSPIWLINQFGIPEALVEPLGYMLMYFYCFIVFTHLFPALGRLKFRTSIFYLIACSPPMMLFVQRGQIDLLVTLCAFATIRLISHRKNSNTIILFVFVLLSLISLVKLYPIIFIISIAFFSKDKRIFFLSFLTLSLLLPRLLIDLTLIPIEVGKTFEDTSMTFGFLNVFERIGQTISFPLSSNKVLILSFLMHFLLWIAIRVPVENSDIETNRELPSEEVNKAFEFQIWTSVFLSCYFLGNNIDFRQIFAILAVSSVCKYTRQQNIRNVLIFLLILNVLLSFESGGLEIFGDITMAVTVIILIKYLIKSLEESFSKMRIFRISK